MNDKDLGDALMRGEDPIDLQALTRRVLRRDRRRVWALSAVCVVAWMLVVMLPWSTLLPAMAKVGQIMQAMNAAPATAGATTPEQQRDVLLVAEVVRQGTIATFLLSIGSMFAAALCTVVLIVVSRRATLRQVNSRLAEISAQIKALAKEAR